MHNSPHSSSIEDDRDALSGPEHGFPAHRKAGGPVLVASAQADGTRGNCRLNPPACPEIPELGKVGVISGESTRRYPQELEQRDRKSVV